MGRRDEKLRRSSVWPGPEKAARIVEFQTAVTKYIASQQLAELNAHRKVLLAFRIEHKTFPNVASAESQLLPSLNGNHS